MFAIILAMTAILLLTTLVLTYVAFVHRGEPVPGAPWLTSWMRQGREKLPLKREDVLTR